MKSILVVDESPTIRETLAIVLGRDHRVATAATIDAIPTAESPALVILGLPTAARESVVVDAALAAVGERVPLLLLSRPGVRTRDRLRRSGRAFSIVAKPFDLHALRAAVDLALAEPPSAPAPTSWRSTARRWLEHPYVTRECALIASRAIATDLPVLVIGTGGTGASDVARALHVGRGRPGRFVVRSARDLDDRALRRARRRARRGTLFVDDVHAASREAQHALLALLREQHETSDDLPDVVTATDAPLDERVARGDFLSELAHTIAGAVLRLTPLRDRADDVPALVEVETARVARRLGLGDVTYTEPALVRLARYLWFGDVAELTAVITRTVAVRRPQMIDATDLLFDSRDIARDAELSPAEEPAGRPRNVPPSQSAANASERRARALHAIPATTAAAHTLQAAPAAAERAELPSLEVLVGELAHELRNPMVTIKTFAQHLDSVLADPEVRARFSALAGDAITRMDALLENLLDFARFRAPQRQPTDLRTLMDRALAECADDLARKDVRVEWGGEVASRVDADEAQLLFAFRSLLGGLLPALLPHEPLRVSVTDPFTLALNAHTERTVSQRLAQLVGDERDGDGQTLPLAFALAAALIRRNGGMLRTALGADGRTAITVEWPARRTQEGA